MADDSGSAFSSDEKFPFMSFFHLNVKRSHSFQEHYTGGEKSWAHSNYLHQHVWNFKPRQPKQSLPVPVSQNWIPKRTQNTLSSCVSSLWAHFDYASDADKSTVDHVDDRENKALFFFKVWASHFFVISHAPSSLVLFQLHIKHNQSTHSFAESCFRWCFFPFCCLCRWWILEHSDKLNQAN